MYVETTSLIDHNNLYTSVYKQNCQRRYIDIERTKFECVHGVSVSPCLR